MMAQLATTWVNTACLDLSSHTKPASTSPTSRPASSLSHQPTMEEKRGVPDAFSIRYTTLDGTLTCIQEGDSPSWRVLNSHFISDMQGQLAAAQAEVVTCTRPAKTRQGGWLRRPAPRTSRLILYYTDASSCTKIHIRTGHTAHLGHQSTKLFSFAFANKYQTIHIVTFIQGLQSIINTQTAVCRCSKAPVHILR